jgi:EmrB/QacA subfamily drug resistance transporter
MQRLDRPLIVALIVSCAFFMQQLDGTIIATALPRMAAAFHDLPVNLSIGMTAYLLTVAACIPTSGWMADRYGSRTVFAGAIVVFTVGSILCGLSNSLAWFTGARIVQGIGGAMMVPVGRLVVLRGTPKSELIRAMSFITIPGLVAPVLGPPLGGFITTFASWRWIFLLNIPIGILGLLLVRLFMQDEKAPDVRPFDGRGFLLSACGLTGIVFGLNAFARPDTHWPLALATIVGGLALTALAVRHALRHPQPLLSLKVLEIKNYAIGTLWGGMAFRITVGALPFLWPLLFQLAFGYTAFLSGVLVMVCSIGDLSMQALTRRILARFGFRRTLLVNGGVIIATTALCATLVPQTPLAVIAALLLCCGLSRSLQFTGVNTLAYVDIPAPLMSSASSLASTFQQLAIGFGVAFGAIALRAAAAVRGGEAGIPQLVDFRLAFGLVALVGVLSWFYLSRLAHDAGAAATLPSRGSEARGT